MERNRFIIWMNILVVYVLLVGAYWFCKWKGIV